MTTPGPSGQHGTPLPGFSPPAQPGGGPSQPVQRPGASKPSKGDGRGSRLLVFGIAVVALVLAIISAGLSWRTSSRLNDALDELASPLTASTTATAEPTQEPTTASPTPEEPTGESPGAVPELNAKTQYKVRYTNETLRVSSTDCSDLIYIDLDEPRVRSAQGIADLRFQKPCTVAPAGITLSEGVTGSEVESEAVTPTECADRIRTSPLAEGNHPTRKGQVYCIVTSLGAARSTAVTWKLVVLTATATAEDGTVTYKASAWDIPL